MPGNTSRGGRKISEKYSNRDWLYNEYICKRKSMETIGKEVGVSRKTIGRRLSKFGIKKSRPNKKLPYFVVEQCFHCESHFQEEKGLHQRNQINKYEKRFCGSDCLREFKRIEMTGKGNHNYGGTYQGLHYRDMSKDSQIKRNSKVSATRISLGISKGVNNGRWLGGVSSLNEYLRRNTRDWAEKVMERDGFSCIITGDKGSDLHVHHLKPFNAIRDDILNELNIDVKRTMGEYSGDEIDAILTELRRRHPLSNGVTLKSSIHESFHEEYGFDCVEEDFHEFKRMYDESKTVNERLGTSCRH